MRFAFCLAVLLGLLALACSSRADAPSSSGVVIEPIGLQSTPLPVGGKPDPPSVLATAGPASPAATALSDPGAPQNGRWIDVDVTRYRVRLMDGPQVVKAIEPVGVGAQINTGAYESTQTGLFHVYNKVGGLQYDPPYKTYISDWVGFDPAKANGFHSFLQDERGNVVNAATGRVSNGCIRTGDSAIILAFAEIGMPVYVHV